MYCKFVPKMYYYTYIPFELKPKSDCTRWESQIKYFENLRFLTHPRHIKKKVNILNLQNN